MTDRTQQVYVIQGRAERDYADCQAAVARVPARMTALSFMDKEDEVIGRARDADALVVSSTHVTHGVMSALEGLKVVVRTGVGYDVIDVPAATDLGVIVVNVPDIWVREVANHALALLLAWNRKIITLDRNVHAGSWGGGVPSILGTQFAHVGGMTKIPWLLAGGATLYVLTRWRAADVLRLTAEHRMPTLNVGPTQVALLMRQPDLDSYDLSCVRAIIAGTGPSSPAR